MASPHRCPPRLNINVINTNVAPVAQAQSVSTNEDTALPITLAGTDADNNPLTYSIVTQPANGTLSGTAPNLTYTPSANYNGSDSFTFKVNDGSVDSTVATISITINSDQRCPGLHRKPDRPRRRHGKHRLHRPDPRRQRRPTSMRATR